MEQIYLDFNATTPIDPEVAAEMRPFLDLYFGNPSSSHAFGVKTRAAVEKARERTALLLNCSPDEVIFTSGGTESNNMAIKGAAFAMRSKGNHLIISAVEHPAVTEVAAYLTTQGFEVSIAPVDRYGLVDTAAIRSLLKPETILVSVMHANNEVGTIQPIAEISELAHRNGALMHTDAAQSAGKIPVDVKQLGVDLLSVAGHKLYASKGVGALYIRKGVTIEKLIHGADHEQNMRAGTENVLEIAGLGKACEVAYNRLESYGRHTSGLRERFIDSLSQRIGGFQVNGHPEKVLPNTLSISFRNQIAQTLLAAIPEIAASAGAACHTGDTETSSVLGAMQVSPEYAPGTIRFSFGITTTEDEVDKAVEVLANTLRTLTDGENQTTAGKDDGNEIRLTAFTHGLGCACKIVPARLDEILAGIPTMTDPSVLVGTENKDDAAVYRINDELAVVQTVDFLTPVIDDPFSFGEIAAANALSDIYAMGAKPAFALSIAAFPVNRLPLSALNEILKGAAAKAAEAGIPIVGGHSVEDNEPKYGMVVTGFAHPGKVIRNKGAKPGDVLVLTKPLGTGIISTAAKMGIAGEKAIKEAEESMKLLNRIPAELMAGFGVHACTDVTGFGLTGHLHEMALASEVDAEVVFENLPFLSEVRAYAMAGAVPGGTKANLEYASQWTGFGILSLTEKYMVCDAQTSGGLLISMPPADAEKYMESLSRLDIRGVVIGRITGSGEGKITVI